MKNLNKLFIIIIMMIVSYSAMNADTGNYTVLRSGGQLNGVWPFRWEGYATVYNNPTSLQMSCTGAGILACSLPSISGGYPFPAEVYNDLIHYAELQIGESNVLSGSYNNDIIYGGVWYYRNVSWTTNNSTGESEIYISIYTL